MDHLADPRDRRTGCVEQRSILEAHPVLPGDERSLIARLDVETTVVLGGDGFRGGEAAGVLVLTKAGLSEIVGAKDVRASDLPWIPDHSYRSNLLLAHRLGVNAFFWLQTRPTGEGHRARVHSPGAVARYVSTSTAGQMRDELRP